MLDKLLYNTVLSQTFSPCGKYLVAGNIYSQIAVFDLDRITNPIADFTPDCNKPKYIHTVENANQICSLVSTDTFLIAGTVHGIIGWNWKTVLCSKLGKPSWSINIPAKGSTLEQLDVNSLWLSEDKETLYAGCGDNNAYSFSLEDGKHISTYHGHTDYLHCIHGKDQHLITAAEDGLVKLWDIRTGKSQYCVEPHTNSKVSRPELGKWIGAVALGDHWFVCGGGPRAALWHLQSSDAVTTFDIQDKGIHVALFNDDCVVLGGTSKHLYQASYSGEVRVELPVSATTVYSAIIRSSPNRVLAVAGSSSEIDLCTTFKYRDHTLLFR